MTKEDILRHIEKEDVEFIRLQFTDCFGNLKNFAVTPGQLERSLNNEYTFDGSAMFDDQIECDEMLYLHPDYDSFVILPWRPQHGKVGKFICDVCHEDGTPFEYSPRTILKNVLDRAAKEGYSFRVNPECEFFLFNTDDSGNPTTTVHEKAGYLDVGPLDFGENARRDLVLTLEEMGFEIESSHHEKAPAQHEIDFTAGEALDTADDIMTFKFAVRSIAKRFGLYATFMPKPRADLAGSGMHLSFSMYKDGVNLFDSEGGAVSDTAAAFMAGIIAHSEGICAITNPTVNSYKRIMADRGAIATVAWTSDNKKQPVRIRKKFGETKVELRFPDPSANPYLAIAACITAGLDGVKNSLKLCAEGKDTGKCLPTDLKGALRKFKKDSYICESLGEAFAAKYVELKEEEWNDYMLQVSDWEVARYLHKM